jgi:hypothetical protein
MLRYGESALTSSTTSSEVMPETMVISSSDSVSGSFTRSGVSANSDPARATRVYPSGGPLITCLPPTAPFAPGWFTTTTALPSASVRPRASARELRSVLPPAANGATSCTGLVGYPSVAPCRPPWIPPQPARASPAASPPPTPRKPRRE